MADTKELPINCPDTTREGLHFLVSGRLKYIVTVEDVRQILADEPTEELLARQFMPREFTGNSD